MKENQQTSYKNIKWVFVTGKTQWLTWVYCTDIFNTLNKIEQNQVDIADMLNSLSGLKWNSLINQKTTISEKFNKDMQTLDNLEIIKTPETWDLEELKIKNIELLANNKNKFFEILSWEKINNFHKIFKDSNDSKSQILD